MGFLTSLGTAINEQFGFGENSVTTLDTVDGQGRVQNFGLLGDFAKKIDQSAERSYVEDGFIRNIRPRLREIIWQKPDMTVLIKKRMFSSLSENYKLDKLEENERLFLRATKKLFLNKCKVISAYELLSKIETISVEQGYVNSFMLPSILNGVQELENAGFGNLFDDKTRSTFNTLRRVHAFSEPNITTTWLVDNQSAFVGDQGEGTGVIELTMVASVNTKSSTEFAAGSAGLTIEDPYKLLIITNDDIDQAIKDASNYFKNSIFGKFTEIETRRLIESQKLELNTLRTSRNASRILFSLNPASIISKRVTTRLETGFVGGPNVIENTRPTPEINFTYNSGLVGLGSSVEIDPIALTGKEGLNDSEASLFKEIISNIFLLLGFENTTRTNTIEFNESTNYVRRKMRLQFGGKPMIQPMDIVNIFVASHTSDDLKITQGLDSTSRGLAFGQKLDSLVRNIDTTLGNLTSFFYDSKTSVDEIEKASIVGAEFPTWLWRLYRNDFTRQPAGTSVFVGLVIGASHNYSASDGKYMLNVNCEDNAGYFKKSQINLRPSLDVFNSVLYDPLTPFKVSFDAATGVAITDTSSANFPELLDENKQLLKSEAVKFKSGHLRGVRAEELLYKTKDREVVFNDFRYVLNDPDGFVYRWKEGIGSLTKSERAYPETSIRQEISPFLTKNPFAGQDVMNVLSLLISGQPYNYNTFLRAAIDNANSLVSRDEINNKDVAITYIESLTNDLSKRNAIWGNFVPFKKLIINEAADAFIRTGQNDFVTQNQQLNSLLSERARLQDELALRNRSFANNPQTISRAADGQVLPLDPNSSFTTANRDLVSRIDELNRQIDDIKRRFQSTITNLAEQKLDNRILIIGDDVSLDPGLSDAGTEMTEEQRSFDKQEFRRRINFLTQRRLWKVKGNEDPNLFIVDDQYDKNFDIQAFERKLAGKMNLFESEYLTIDNQIKEVSTILGLEVFADTQGHIQARPPQYNKVPSSVFYRMFKEREKTGIKVFPQFLESLFVNQLQSQINRLEIIEDEIRIRILALGVVPTNVIDPDKTIAGYLRGFSNLETGAQGTQFSFVSDFNTGKVGGKDFQGIIFQSNPDLTEDFANNVLNPISENVGKATQTRRLFDSVSRDNILQKVNFQAINSQQNVQRINSISTRLQREKGGNAPDLRSLFANDRFHPEKGSSFNQINSLHILNQVAAFISERQKLLIQLSNTIKNLSDGIKINETDEGSTRALFPFLNRKKPIPDILEHMIEDEELDDLGPGSSGRFTIKDSNIINLKIEETPPPFTLVQVNGLFGEGLAQEPPNLRLTPNGGNFVTSAFAVDYDMWRMYGFRAPQSVAAPFLSDPNTQCAPYAVYLLNLARKNILKGTVTLIGNEYYQPGDVVYIEDRDLLFYVRDVSHNFSFSGSFNTTLTLEYGHTPGEYIPNILDIVGKSLYKAKDFTTIFRSNRFDSANGDIPVGIINFDNNPTVFTSTLEQILGGKTGEANKKALNNLLLSTTGALSPVNFRALKPILELRIYTSSKTYGSANNNLVAAANAVKEWLNNPQEYNKSGKGQLIPISLPGGIIPQNDNIRVKIVDVSKDSDSPSSSAWNTVRALLENKNVPDNTVFDNISILQDVLLYTHIIDAWLTFETPVDVTESTPQGARIASQAAQLENAAVNLARDRRSNT